MRHVEAEDWKVLGPVSSPSQSDPIELTPMPEDTDRFTTTSYENKQGKFKFAPLDKMKSNDSGTAYFTKNFHPQKAKPICILMPTMLTAWTRLKSGSMVPLSMTQLWREDQTRSSHSPCRSKR